MGAITLPLSPKTVDKSVGRSASARCDAGESRHFWACRIFVHAAKMLIIKLSARIVKHIH
jgi:hypothetical protein